MSDDHVTEWVYWVNLDGDFAGDYATAEAAEHARLHERGHIPPDERSIWRERTEVQDVYPAKQAPHE